MNCRFHKPPGCSAMAKSRIHPRLQALDRNDATTMACRERSQARRQRQRYATSREERGQARACAHQSDVRFAFKGNLKPIQMQVGLGPEADMLRFDRRVPLARYRQYRMASPRHALKSTPYAHSLKTTNVLWLHFHQLRRNRSHLQVADRKNLRAKMNRLNAHSDASTRGFSTLRYARSAIDPLRWE